MRWKTSKKRAKKLIEKVNRKVDREMKAKYGDAYKTKPERLKDLRRAKKRVEIMEIIFLVQQLQATGQLNEEVKKLSAHLPSEFDKFLN